MARNYYKSNFIDAVKIMVPDVYLDDDYSASGVDIKDTDVLINSHIKSLSKLAQTLAPSSVEGSNLFSSVENIEGFSQFFVSQNNLTNITTDSFYTRILKPLGKNISSYSTSSSFGDYVSGTLLPLIHLNSSSLVTDTSGVFGTDSDEIRIYLMDHLSWLYFLNTSGPAYNPSSIVALSIVDKFYNNKPYRFNDGIKDYQKYLWQNYSSFSSLDTGIIPSRFTSGTGTYTSGNQNLDKLQTLVDIVYSPLFIDKENTEVREAIDSYIITSSLLHNTEYVGPFSKFLKAISYSFFDINDEVENIGNLLSIDDCPAKFLPLLSNLLGWKLYGKNEQSWRNQIRNAANLYRKKGTKQALLEAFNTIIVQNPLNTSGSLTELYESYVPNLLYYLLKTESNVFDSFDGFSVVAETFGFDQYSTTDMDFNIRIAVDTILLDAVRHFPELFIIKNEPFRVTVLDDGTAWFGEVALAEDGNYYTAFFDEFGELVIDPATAMLVDIIKDPAFTFNFRNRDFPIPPWEEEKFYHNCIVNSNLLAFLVSKLADYCVTASYRDSFRNYVYGYSVSSNLVTDLYIENSFLFFTSAQQYAPNMEAMLIRYDEDNYDYLSLWNGKSSTFDFSVCAGPFISDMFSDVSSLHTVNDIFNSLVMVHEMSPAKAVPRVRVSKFARESASGYESVCPSIRIPFQDVPLSGAPVGLSPDSRVITGGLLANFELSGVYDRATGYALGNDVHPGYNDASSAVSHANVPVFRRERTNYAFDAVSSVVNTSATVPSTSAIPRASTRRRNFAHALTKSGWFDRSGKSMPTFYNNTSSSLEFVPLGYNPSSFGFAPATEENLSGVYAPGDCSTVSSTLSFFGIPVSGTFLTRNYSTLSVSSCDQLARRDTLPQEIKLFFDLDEKKKESIAKAVVNNNKEIFSLSGNWANQITSVANRISDEGYEKYYSPNLDIRNLNGLNTGVGVHYIYKQFTNFFSGTGSYPGLPEKLATTYKDGGPNIISHTYGSIYHNSNFSIDGSAVDTSAELISGSLRNPYTLNFGLSGGGLEDIGMVVLQGVQSPAFGKTPEMSTIHIVSGVEIVDSSTTLSRNNQFVIFDLEESSELKYNKKYLVGNRNVLMRSRSDGLPRLRYGLRTNAEKNMLIPNSDYELTLNYLTGNDRSPNIGAYDRLGVVIHTKPEYLTKEAKYVFFVWTPNNEWELVDVTDFQSDGWNNTIVSKYTHSFKDERKTIDSPVGFCGEEGSIPSLYSIDSTSYTSAKIKFHTRNNLTDIPFNYGTNYIASHSHIYDGRFVMPHRGSIEDARLNQNYIIEVFAIPAKSDSTSFVLLDYIDVINKTLNDAARIPYKACIPDTSRGKSLVHAATIFKGNGEELLPISEETLTVEVGTDQIAPNKLRHSAPGGTEFTPLSEGWQNLADAMHHHVIPAGDPREKFFMEPLVNYTGAPNYSYTCHEYGFDYALQGGPGEALGWNTIPNYNPNFFGGGWLPLVANYFGENGGLYLNTNPFTPWQGYPIGSFASINKWSNAVFDGRIHVGVNGLNAGAVRTDKITNVWGLLQGISQKLRTTNTRTTTPQGDTYRRNPLGYSFVDDIVSHNIPQEAVPLFPPGVPLIYGFMSRRWNPATYLELTNQQDKNYSYLIDPMGVIPKARIEENYPHFFNPSLESSNPFWPQATMTRALPQPMATYQDVKREDLDHQQMYTFQIYVAKPGIGHSTEWGTWEEQGNGAHGGGTVETEAATSAIITLLPIDSSSSYTRLTLNLNTEASSIQKGGESASLTDAAAARCTTVIQPAAGFAAFNMTYYKMEVSLPYNALERDKYADTIAGSIGIGPPGNMDEVLPNYGLRCCVQAYNDRYDGLLPFDHSEINDDNHPLDVTTTLVLWGPSLTKTATGATWFRYLTTHPGVQTDITGFTGPIEIMDYAATGNILNLTEYGISGDRIIHMDKKGELSYSSRSSSSLDKLTVGLPQAGNLVFPTKLITKPIIRDASSVVVSGVDMTLNQAKKLMFNDNELSISSGEFGSNMNKCIIGTTPLKPRELLHLFRYFNHIGQATRGSGFNSRVAPISPGWPTVAEVHASAGGSRLSYRTNPINHNLGISGTTHHNFTNLNIFN